MTLPGLALSDLALAVDGEILCGGATKNFFGVQVHARLRDSSRIDPRKPVLITRPQRWGKHYEDLSLRLSDLERMGAACFITDVEVPARFLQDTRACIIFVPDSVAALRRLAAFQRNRIQGYVTAITGTAGKTTTKDMLAMVSAKFIETFKSPYTANTTIENYVNISNTPVNVEHAIYELGIEGPNSLWSKSVACRPDFSIITSVGPAHLEKFYSLKNLATSKAEVFYGMQPEGTIMLYDDCAYLEQIIRLAKNKVHADHVLTYGRRTTSDFQIEAVHRLKSATEVTARIFSERVKFKLPPNRPHLEVNSLPVLARCKLLNIDVDLAANELAKFSGSSGRSQILTLPTRRGQIKVIDDSYNANLVSIAAGLDTLDSIVCQRKVAVIGQIAELGRFEEQVHCELAGILKTRGLSELVCVGAAMKAASEQLKGVLSVHYAPSREDVVEILRGILRSGDAVLVKGSNVVGLGVIVDDIRVLVESSGFFE